MTQEAFTFIDGGAAGNQMINKKELTESFPRGKCWAFRGKPEIFLENSHSWLENPAVFLRYIFKWWMGTIAIVVSALNGTHFGGDQRMQVHGIFWGGFPSNSALFRVGFI